jgi:hypothetical protein
MTIRLVTACAGALAALCLLTPSVSACNNAQCPVELPVMPETQAQPEPQPQAEAPPLQLKKFTRRPVASAATRTVRKADGSYAKVPMKRRTAPQPPVAAAEPAASIDMSQAATQAFAWMAAAQVRVVSPNEVNEIDLAADAAPVMTSVEVAPAVPVVRADEVNELDRQADTPTAVSLDRLNRTLGTAAAPPDGDDTGSWFARMLAVLGGAFAAAAAAARLLIG